VVVMETDCPIIFVAELIAARRLIFVSPVIGSVADEKVDKPLLFIKERIERKLWRKIYYYC